VASLAALAGDPIDAPGPDDGTAARHHALAREVAAACVVLLRNEGGTLPLARDARIAVVGEFARTARFQGGGSSRVTATRVDAPLDALRALVDGDVPFAAGFPLDGDGDAVALREEAVALAAGAEVTVVFAGLGDRDESEGFDREHLELPAAQVELVRAVAAACPRTVVVLSHGGVVSLEGWHDDVDAVVDGALLGQAGGGALADVLLGIVNPSGRLAETVPRRLQDNPSYANFPGEQGHVRYGEGVLVGYRWYTTLGIGVRYPFGHGLSYTTFTTSGLRVRPTGRDSAAVSVTVANTGTRAGKEVVQLYTRDLYASVEPSMQRLRDFRKITLAPGERRTVTFRVPVQRLAFVGRDNRPVVEPGDFDVMVGGLTGRFTVR
jgi:beta-glucosidase